MPNSQSSTANIILQATNDITIDDLADDELDMDIQSGASSGQRGSLTIIADFDEDGSGDFSMNIGDEIRTRRPKGERIINHDDANTCPDGFPCQGCADLPTTPEAAHLVLT